MMRIAAKMKVVKTILSSCAKVMGANIRRASLLSAVILISGILIFPTKSKAAVHLTSDFDSSIGFMSLNVRVGESYKRTIESLSTIELNYNLNFSGSSTSVSFSMMEMVKAEQGYLPLTHFGLQIKWYPFHLNGMRNVLDTGVEGKVWKATPFFATTIGASNISAKDTLGSYNAFVIDAILKAGVEVPAATDWLLIGQFGYVVSMMGTNPDPSRTMSYNGIIVLFGFKVNSF